MSDAEALAELPRVADLLQEHKDAIAAVRAQPEVAPILGPEHDELFVLRYVISFREVGKAAVAIKQAIEWRRENTDILSRIDDLQAEVKTIIPTGMLPWRTNQGQPIQVAIPFAVDVTTWATKSEQWHHEAGISNREVAYRICDQLTRESGRLIKLVIIQDLTGLNFQFAMQNSKLVQNQGKLSKLSEFLFPQLIQTVVVTHPPSFIATLYKGFSPLLSERLIKKVKMAENVDKLIKVRAAARTRAPYSRARPATPSRGAAARAQRTSLFVQTPRARTCTRADASHHPPTTRAHPRAQYAGLQGDRVPTFLGGTFVWDAAWVPQRVKAKTSNGSGSNSPRPPPNAPPLGTSRSGGAGTDSPSLYRSAFSFNPFGNGSKQS